MTITQEQEIKQQLDKHRRSQGGELPCPLCGKLKHRRLLLPGGREVDYCDPRLQ